MRFLRTLAFAAAWSVLGASSAFAEVQLTMHDGHVTIVAKDATLRQILSEWSRVGQTKIVNLERVAGAPLTLELRDVSEQQALDVLLRSLSGYMAAPRATIASDASVFDRIILIPTSSAPRAPVTPAPQTQPFVQQRPGAIIPQQQPPNDDVDDDQAAPNVVQPPPQRPVFPTFPQPQVVNPNGPGATPGAFQPGQGQPVNGAPPPGAPPPSQPAGAPFGVSSRPGVIVQPPPQPGQTVNPGQQPQRSPNDD